MQIPAESLSHNVAPSLFCLFVFGELRGASQGIRGTRARRASAAGPGGTAQVGDGAPPTPRPSRGGAARGGLQQSEAGAIIHATFLFDGRCTVGQKPV